MSHIFIGYGIFIRFLQQNVRLNPAAFAEHSFAIHIVDTAVLNLSFANSSITSTVLDKTGSATSSITTDKITSEVGSSKMEVGKEQIKESVGNSYEKLDNSGVTIEGQQIFIGEGATEPAVLGTQLVNLMVEFITECSKITTPTMLGTMPIVNLANFIPFLAKCNSFLSQTVKVK